MINFLAMGLGFFAHASSRRGITSPQCCLQQIPAKKGEGGLSVDVPKGWAAQWVELADVHPLTGHFQNQRTDGQGAAPYPAHPSLEASLPAAAAGTELEEAHGFPSELVSKRLCRLQSPLHCSDKVRRVEMKKTPNGPRLLFAPLVLQRRCETERRSMPAGPPTIEIPCPSWHWPAVGWGCS